MWKAVENHVENVEKFSHHPRELGLFAVQNRFFAMCKTAKGKEIRFSLAHVFPLCYNKKVVFFLRK